MKEHRLPDNLTEIRLLREARNKLKGELSEKEALDLLRRIEFVTFALIPSRIERMSRYGKRAHVRPEDLEKVKLELEACRSELLKRFPALTKTLY